jgi:hypothetical protein
MGDQSPIENQSFKFFSNNNYLNFFFKINKNKNASIFFKNFDSILIKTHVLSLN